MKHTCPICSVTFIFADWGKHMMENHLEALKPAIKVDDKTNFEAYLEEQLKNPAVKEAFEGENK